VYLEDPPKDDVQQSFFLAETLKVRNLIKNDQFIHSKKQSVLRS